MATVSFKKFEVLDDNGDIVLKHYDDIGSGGPQVAASFEIALDPDFKQIVDATYFNREHLESWSSALPKIGGPDGTYYTNLEKLYARGRVYAGVIPHDFDLPSYATDEEVNEKCDATKTIFYSPWSEVAIGTQTFQEVLITEDGEDDIHTDSDKIGMKFNAKP
jgi:hypothetical protein